MDSKIQKNMRCNKVTEYKRQIKERGKGKGKPSLSSGGCGAQLKFYFQWGLQRRSLYYRNNPGSNIKTLSFYLPGAEPRKAADSELRTEMAHGGYGKRRVAERKPHVGRRSKGIGVEKKPKPKSVSLKNQIRSIERMLRKVPCKNPCLLLLFSFSSHIKPKKQKVKNSMC